MIKSITLDFSEKTVTMIWDNGQSLLAKFIDMSLCGFDITDCTYEKILSDMEADLNVEWIYK